MRFTRLTRLATDTRSAAICAAVGFTVGFVLDVAGAPPTLYAPAFAIGIGLGGWVPATDGLRALRRRRLDVDLLMVVAALAAVALGQWRDGALLILIFATTGALEHTATVRTAAEIRTLVVGAPDVAELVLAGGDTAAVAPSDLQVGDRVLVRSGGRVPADGVVVEGEGAVDEVSLTGEPLPARKVPGRAVLAGTTLTEGVVVVQVSHVAADSTLARLATAVDEAIEQRPPTQQFVERFEQRYSVGVVAASVVLAVVGPLWWSWNADETVMRTMTFLVVASPCAVVLATMPATLSALAVAARHRVLVRGGAALERLAEVEVAAFDKTGTLTCGAPRVVAIESLVGDEPDRLLALAAAAERWSEHPLGRALVATAAQRGLVVPPASDVELFASRGVCAVVHGALVRVGGAALLDVDLGDPEDGTVRIGVEVDGRLRGVIALEDAVRAEAPDVVADLVAAGVRGTVLVTGDRESAAVRVGAAVGIGDVAHGLLPHEKAAVVGGLGDRVVFVGDGVNDAAALAAASVGVGLGRGGAALAVDAADVVLMDDDLRGLTDVLVLARRTRRVVRVNLAFALSAIAVLIALDVAGRLPLVLGVLGHEGSSAIVALNGLWLLRWRPPRRA